MGLGWSSCGTTAHKKIVSDKDIAQIPKENKTHGALAAAHLSALDLTVYESR